MILQALNEYYNRLSEQQDSDVSEPGYSPERISYEILLDKDGNVVQVNNISDTSGKKPKPRVLQVPQAEKRTVGIKPNFLWDKTSYVLGVGLKSNRADKEHEAFKEFHLKSIPEETDDSGLLAFRRFLEKWTPDQFVAPKFLEEMKDTNLVFRFEEDKNSFLHERKAARELRKSIRSAASNENTAKGGGRTQGESTCLITGKRTTPARLTLPSKECKGLSQPGRRLYPSIRSPLPRTGRSRVRTLPYQKVPHSPIQLR